MVPRAGYGWLEFITSRPLPGPGSAAEFYRRAGVLLAALYATHAADMHSENLIASGAVPVLVDVETLFHPDLPVPRTTAADPAAEALAASVHRAGLLPYVTIDENGALDRSGIGGQDWNSAAGNRPRLGAELAEPADHEPALLEGFRLGYDAITAERAAFVRLIERCGDFEVRTIARPTRGYARLIDESAHPGLLRDARDRDKALDVLREASAHHPLWAALTRYELADLWNGDIPLMTSHLSATDIWTSAGQRLPGVLDRSGLRCALDKVAAMGEADRRDQEWVILASLAIRRPHAGHRDAAPMPEPVTATAAEPGRLLAAACGLADQIVTRASGGRDEIDRSRVNWLGLQLVEDTQWMMLPMGAGLADGYLEVALFLAQLARLTGIDRYADVARRAVGALPELLSALDGRPELVSAIGVEADHPLVGGVDRAMDVITGDDGGLVVVPGVPADAAGHGTACASVIRAIAPGVSLTSVRVLTSGKHGSGAALLKGLSWVIEEGFDVINMSLSTAKSQFCDALRELADKAYFRRCILVASAHNMPVQSYPWPFASVISVASHDGPDPMTYYYNPSPPVDFYARGVRVRVAWPGGGETLSTGNSFAAPHITAISALILSKHRMLTPFQLKSVLYLAAENVVNPFGDEREIN